MLWNLKIRGKIAVGYFMIVLLLGLFLLIVQGRIKELEKETELLSGHDMHVNELIEKIEKNVLDMETGQRGFALTGKESYLVPYNEGNEDWQENFADLKGMITDATQLENLENIRDNIKLWIEEAGQPVVQNKQQGHEDEVASYFQADTGKAIVDQIRSQSDRFRQIEAGKTAERVVELKDRNQELFLTMYVLWTLVALASIIASTMISGGIVRAMKDVIAMIQGISEGRNLKTRLNVSTKDEINDLVEMTNRLLDKVEKEQIASDRITSMSLKLQEKTDIYSLCDTFLYRMATVLEFQFGAIYVARENEDELTKISAYAGGEGRNGVGRERIKWGEGLVGQCAQDQHLIHLSDLPDYYIPVQSGLGVTPPRQLIIAPVLFEGRTVAVIETASLTQWPTSDLELLRRLVDLFGVSVNSVTTRSKIQQLYNEAQIMNEELQTQSEELLAQTHELINLNGKLENQKRVAENTATELETMNVELERSSKYKSEFLANMSHELRTPLNSMLLLSQLLTENPSGNLTEEQRSFASVIHSSGSDLLAIINDILDLSKVEAGKMQIEMSAVNLTEFPSVFQGYFGKTAEAKHLDFSVILHPEIPDLFYTDEMRLHQILRNLLSNAFKFTEKGEVRLEISRRQDIRSEEYTREGPVLAFDVIDTGIGIPPEKSELIFEAFQQADGSTARKFGGTGLGLSISLQLARLLRGHLSLEGRPEGGSIFTLYLPLHEEPWDPEERPAAADGHSESGEQGSADGERENRSGWDQDAGYEENSDGSTLFAGATVLIVDDDQRNLYALSQRLEGYGMRVLTAQSGFECLEKVRSTSAIDLILLDIMMPVLDGYDTLSIIRDEMQLLELPIIAVSAKTMKEERQRCLAAGASDFISKPVQFRELIRIMRYYLRDHAA